MVLDKETLIQLFIKEYNPDLTEEEVKEVVNSYYDFIREEMESGNLEQIRMKYFGSFKPLLGKIQHLEKNINWDKFTPNEKERYVKLFERFRELKRED